MQGKQWIVLVIVLGLTLLGNCGKNKKKGKDKKFYMHSYIALLTHTYYAPYQEAPGIAYLRKPY